MASPLRHDIDDSKRHDGATGYTTDDAISEPSLTHMEREPPPLEKHSMEYDVSSDEDRPDHTHDLRSDRRNATTTFCTWMDKDVSGNYDPDLKKPRYQPRKRKAKTLETSHDVIEHEEAARDDQRRQKKQRRLSPLATHCNGERLVITFRLHSAAAQSLLATTSDHWPEPHNVLASPRQADRNHSDAEDHILSGFDPTHTPGQRTRGSTRTRYPKKLELGEASGEVTRPNLTGHPAARGCWACVELKLECPLLKDPAAWPCSVCIEDDHDCEYVTAPKRRRPCEECKRQKKTCSYNWTSDTTAPCLNCRIAGCKCVAGPTIDSIRIRACLDRDWETYPPPPKVVAVREDWSCAQCVNTGSHCSNVERKADTACISCEMADLTCTEADDSTVNEVSIAQRHQDERERTYRKPEPPSYRERPLKVRPSLPTMKAKTIKTATKLCHPVNFNHYDPFGIDKCHFCSTPIYSLFGLGLREVEVIEWPDWRPLTEISGGHLGEGKEPIRLCIDCTTTRLQQLGCAQHNIVPISGVNPAGLDFIGAFGRLQQGTPLLTDHWCSVCPALALDQCGDTMAGARSGCGLKLCQGCSLQFANKHNANLQALLGGLEDRPTDQRPFGLRADLELLRADGVLARYWARGMQ